MTVPLHSNLGGSVRPVSKQNKTQQKTMRDNMANWMEHDISYIIDKMPRPIVYRSYSINGSFF